MRPPMSKQKWRRRKVPRWLVRCAPHQAIGSLIPPDICFGAGCPPEDLISRRLSSPCYGGPDLKVPRWLVRCAPHQAIGSLIPPDICFGAGCPPEDLISRRLSSPCYGGPRVRIHLPPAPSQERTGGQAPAPLSRR